MLYFYYRKSIDKMILCNTDPSDEWKENGRGGHCELYIEGEISFKNAFAKLIPEGEKQNLVRYAMLIEALGEPGDEYDDSLNL